MIENVRVKPLTEKELEQVLELDDLCFGGLWSKDGYIREINSPNSCLLIAIANTTDTSTDKVIGLACFWAILEEAHITILAIHPDFQGQGYGKYLLKQLLVEINNRELKTATLEVSDKNIKALSLYQKFGFKEAGRRKKYYQKTGEDALILWRKFTEEKLKK